jgi:hypothetical protein
VPTNNNNRQGFRIIPKGADQSESVATVYTAEAAAEAVAIYTAKYGTEYEAVPVTTTDNRW